MSQPDRDQGGWIDPALRIEGVHKAYGSRVALAGIDLVVERGEILGLLGPNGAGKTSLVSIVAGVRRADRGTVEVMGVDTVRAAERARRSVGYAPQETGVYHPLTVRQNLRFFARLAGFRRRALRDEIDRLGGALGLTTLMDRRALQLSGGERRRLHTAIALIGRPPLVLLDEPTVGADVTTRSELLAYVRTLADDGAAVVYSSHYLQEIETLGASVAIIDRGSIRALGSLESLLTDHASSAVAFTFDHVPPELRHLPGVTIDGATARIATDSPAHTAARILAELGPSELAELRGLEVIEPSLEGVFLSVTAGAPAEMEPA
ncbi:MAG TPA: ABC transporter ATP-binding protein [Acidimicrobiia bacterium]|jgi:ABC-2 type transport system ATP-binding protein